VDTVNSFLYEFLLDVADEWSQIRWSWWDTENMTNTRPTTDRGVLQTLTNLLCYVREKLQTDLNLFKVWKNNLNCLLDAITFLRRQLSTRLQKEDDTGDIRQYVRLVVVSRFQALRTRFQARSVGFKTRSNAWFHWWERWQNWGSCSRLMSVSPVQSARWSSEYTGTTDSDELLSPLTLSTTDDASTSSWKMSGTLVFLVNLSTTPNNWFSLVDKSLTSFLRESFSSSWFCFPRRTLLIPLRVSLLDDVQVCPVSM
jgi:hypothetical protein